MPKITVQHPGPNNLHRGITPAIARQLLEVTTDALRDAPHQYEFTLALATHGAKLTGAGRITCEAVFMQYAPRIQDMRIMTPEEAVEHWRLAIAAPAARITQELTQLVEKENRDEKAQKEAGQPTLFPV